MADRKPTVLNPAGYQENLQDTDNLIVEAAPTADNHAVNKEFVDDLKLVIDGDIAAAGKWSESSGNLYPKDLSNNIGIGTETPRNIAGFSSLGIDGTSGSLFDLFRNGTREGTVGLDSGGFKVEAVGDSTNIIGITNGSERVHIDTDGDIKIGGTLPGSANIILNASGSASFAGNVGIGTDSPRYKLLVADSTLAEIGVETEGKGEIRLISANDENGHAIRFGGAGGGTTDPRILRFLTIGDAERMRIDAEGRLGIGTDSPTSPLTVDAGNISKAVEVISATPNARIKLSDGDATTGAFVTGIGNALKFETGGSNSRMFIDSTGNVGIGTDTPAEKLHVNGDVKADNFIGNVTGDITGDITGNADSATKLKTARNINGTAFDGTANITTAKWGTARNLNGVSVDGSEDKTLEPYVERDDGSDAARYLAFVDNSSPGYKRLNMDLNLNYNPSTNILNTSISGSAGTIDGLDSTQFLRSDVDDSASGVLTFNGRVNIRGNIDLSDGQNLDFGSSDDVRINYNANNWLYTNFKTGNGIIFQDNGTDKMVLEDSGIFRPSTNNTGTIGSSSNYWSNGYFQNFNVASTLNVRGVIDLADNDIIRFGSGDDAELFCNGSHFYLDLNSGIGNFYIRDGSNTRFTFNDNGAFTCTGKLTAGNFDLESLPTLP